MKTRLTFLIALIYHANFLLAFDATLCLEKNAFVYEKYNFSVASVIDARISVSEPSGFFYQGALNKKRTIGNDSLPRDLINYFTKYPKSFYEPTKIILVVNQINISEIRAGNIDDFEFTLAFDYYRLTDKFAKLEYSQYVKYDKGAGMNKEGSIIKGFSEAMAFAFLQFKNQLMYYKPLNSAPILTEDLYAKLGVPIVKRISDSKINDGIYFNINQLLRNAPVLSTDYTVNDSTLFAGKPTSVDCKTYLVKKVFAIVKQGQLFLYMSDGVYLPAEVENDGNIYLKNIYYKKTKNIFSNGALAGLRGFIPLLAIASDVIELSQKGEMVKIKLNEKTGTLTL